MNFESALRVDDALLDYLGDIFLSLQPGHYRSFGEFVDWYLFGESFRQ